ncbi:MAG: type II secretion system F family protein [Chloroflexota bacterium]
MNLFIIIGLVVVLIGAAVLVFVGLRSPEAKDPLQSRLAEFGSRERPVTLEEIEMSQPFSERVMLPLIRQVGQMTTRFTPEAALEATQHKLDLAGNPGNLDPKMFMAIRIIASVGLGFVLLLAFSLAPEPNWIQNLGLAGLFVALGYYLPDLWLSSKITRRQDEVVKALPDALDLLTVCVEAGLGFDAALGKLTEKWDNDLALAFGRVLQEVRLGKTRREALRDMSYRLDVPDVTSFIAAVLQAEQLGVSMGKILRIQSDQMRMKRRQRAEQKAHQAPIKMLFPMALLIFPTIWLVLLGPAVLLLKNSALSGILGG